MDQDQKKLENDDMITPSTEKSEEFNGSNSPEHFLSERSEIIHHKSQDNHGRNDNLERRIEETERKLKVECEKNTEFRKTQQDQNKVLKDEISAISQNIKGFNEKLDKTTKELKKEGESKNKENGELENLRKSEQELREQIKLLSTKLENIEKALESKVEEAVKTTFSTVGEKKNLEGKSSNSSLETIKSQEIQSSYHDISHVSDYVRLIFNVIAGIMLILFLFGLYSTIKEDCMRRREQEKEMVLLEIQQCAREYQENRCEPARRVKAMESYCLEKEKCMSRDPAMVVRSSKMTAGLVAEILNELIEPLYLKTMIFLFLVFLGAILICCCLPRSSPKLDIKRTREFGEISSRLKSLEDRATKEEQSRAITAESKKNK